MNPKMVNFRLPTAGHYSASVDSATVASFHPDEVATAPVYG